MYKYILRVFVALYALLGVLLWTEQLLAQVPQPPRHVPGTVCYVRQGWCWANPPGPPGGNCACKTPSGWIAGRLG